MVGRDDGGVTPRNVGAQLRVGRSPPLPLSSLPLTADQKHQQLIENEHCERLASREGDRLLRVGDPKGAEVAYKIAAVLRIRRDQMLEPF